MDRSTVSHLKFGQTNYDPAFPMSFCLPIAAFGPEVHTEKLRPPVTEYLLGQFTSRKQTSWQLRVLALSSSHITRLSYRKHFIIIRTEIPRQSERVERNHRRA